MTSDSDIRHLSLSPRRPSSCPDLRDGVIITPGRTSASQIDWEKTAMFMESLANRQGTSLHSIDEPQPPDEGVDITEGHSLEVDNNGIEDLEVEQRSAGDGDRDLPPPTWDEYPPLPDLHPQKLWHWRFWWHGLRKLFGYEGTVDHKENAALFWKVLFDFALVVIAITFLVISAHTPSRSDPSISERAACHKPLAAWTITWIVRLFLSSGRSIWATRRQKLARFLKAHPAPANDVEAAAIDNVTDNSIPGPNPDSEGNRDQPQSTRSQNATAPRLPHTLLFSRLSALLVVFGVAWWFVAQVLLYSSSNCRYSSPHTWWLLFGLVSVQYLAVAELVLFAVLVFIVVPISLLVVNSILLCLGRPPVVPPTRINPEIGKLPKETVARIPLVLYIPHPNSSWIPASQSGVSHSYPPKEISRRAPSKLEGDVHSYQRPKWMPFKTALNKKQVDEWESQWESGLYPFVRLAGSRATCHICLEEFQEPRRRGAELNSNKDGRHSKPEATSRAINDDMNTGFRRFTKFRLPKAVLEDPLKLEVAGEGAQPLRLLACGHVFHRTCIDPWLTDVSGRCPVCQRAVELDHTLSSSEDTNSH